MLATSAANIDERHSFWDLTQDIQGNVIADKGLIGIDFQQELSQFAQINLQTAVRENMKEERSNDFIQWLISSRRLVETIISQWAERFHIEKIRARKLWYLTNRIARKILAHTVVIFINKQLENLPL